MDNILNQAYAAENFRQQGHELIDLLADYLQHTTSGSAEGKVIPWLHPNEQLAYWQEDFQKPLAKPLDQIGRAHVWTPVTL